MVQGLQNKEVFATPKVVTRKALAKTKFMKLCQRALESYEALSINVRKKIGEDGVTG